jgi:hypothetical protein
MTTIELSVDPQYVQSWGRWEALRELLQNGLDARDRGHALSVSRGAGARKTVRITNYGTVLERKTLLLGGTDKRGDEAQRGQFGEGYKLALLVLARQGVEVQVRTGDEMWTAHIEPSVTFGGADCLKIKVRKCEKYEAKVEVLVHDISDEEWATIASRVFAVEVHGRALPAHISVGGSRILTDPAYAGQLYARGLYVGLLPGSAFRFGYDLAKLTLDRDRKMAEWWSLRAEVQSVLERAVTTHALTPEEVFDLLSSDHTEASLLESYYEYSSNTDALTDAMTAVFRARHGDAAPVLSVTDSLNAVHFGVRAVVVGKTLYHVLRRSCESVETAKQRRGLEVERVFSLDDLDEDERRNLEWALALIARVGSYSLSVVHFIGGAIDATWSREHGIRFARRLLADRIALMATLIHEVAHARAEADDGTRAHTASIEHIAATIIAGVAS